MPDGRERSAIGTPQVERPLRLRALVHAPRHQGSGHKATSKYGPALVSYAAILTKTPRDSTMST